MFDPAFYSFKVTGDRRDADFRVAGWTDDFSNVNSGWKRESGQNDYVSVLGGKEYEIKVSPSSSWINVTAPLAVPKSYTVEATMYTQAGSGWHGLIFNAGNLAAGEFYYIFRVNPDKGEAEFIKAVKTLTGTETTTLGIKTNGEINQYNSTISSQVNRLKVVQNVYFAKMFVNGVEVFYDAVDMQAGNHVKVGLYAYAESPSYTARFDDFQLTAMGFSSKQISSAAGIEKSVELPR